MLVSRLQSLAQAFEERGARSTLALLAANAADLWFDWRHGLDTAAWVAISKLDVRGRYRQQAVDYQPTPRLPLLKLLHTAGIPKDGVFLDLGSGKGKALLIAAEFGFRTIRGVEFSPRLCRIAEANCARYTRRTGSAARFRIVETCATDYEFTDDTVIYLFNPFGADVLEIVAANLARSLRERTRRVWIVYRRPLHRESLDAVEGARVQGQYRLWGCNFLVYVVDPPPAAVAAQSGTGNASSAYLPSSNRNPPGGAADR